MSRVLVIDGQGGGLGRQLVAALAAGCPDAELTAVGTNSLAASAMLRAGAPRAATGENAVVVNCRRADVIVGPIGIVIADSLLGEITPAMAAAVCQSDATRVLIPINHCDNIVVGVPDQPIGQLVTAAVEKVKELIRYSKKRKLSRGRASAFVMSGAMSAGVRPPAGPWGGCRPARLFPAGRCGGRGPEGAGP